MTDPSIPLASGSAAHEPAAAHDAARDRTWQAIRADAQAAWDAEYPCRTQNSDPGWLAVGIAGVIVLGVVATIVGALMRLLGL